MFRIATYVVSMTCSLLSSDSNFSRRGSVSALFALFPLLLLPWSPGVLFAQQEPPVNLERGDRVRVWSSEGQWKGRKFDVREWTGDTLVLMEPDSIGVFRLSSSRVERLQLQEETGGNRMLEGALIGGAVGIIPSAVFASQYCSGPASPCGPMKAVGVTFGPMAFFGIVPGGLVGGAIGLAIPERKWVSVELGPATEPEHGANIGLSIRVQLQASLFQ